jgi:hypothetical protein
MYWKIRLSVKMLAGEIAVLKRLFRKLGYFRHGQMDSAHYATGVFARHLACFPAGRPLRAGSACMELGPGDSVLTLLSARAAGFERTFLIDQGHPARKDMELYRSFAQTLIDRGYDLPPVSPHWNLEALLSAYGGEYLTNGLDSLASVATSSVDFSFSHAVLEHLPREQVLPTLTHLRRVSRPGSVSSHVVDLRDHLGGSLNHLRFSSRFWESESVRRSGVYTNRLRYSQWREAFAEAGWRFSPLEIQTYPRLPVQRARLAPEFGMLAETDLLVHGFHGTLHLPEDSE